jgi:hypothetical protein
MGPVHVVWPHYFRAYRYRPEGRGHPEQTPRPSSAVACYVGWIGLRRSFARYSDTIRWALMPRWVGVSTTKSGLEPDLE